MSYLSHYKCVKCNKVHSLIDEPLYCEDCGHLLFAEYDLYRARKEWYQKKFEDGSSIWKYRELLPAVPQGKTVSLNEGLTPFLTLQHVSNRLGEQLYVKNEGVNPSGSVRDREMSVLFTALGGRLDNGILINGTPNSAISAAGYAARCGISCYALLPNSVPLQFLGELNSYGAKPVLYKSGIHREELEKNILREKKLIKADAVSTPFRIEGAKTILFEIWEFFKGELPDYIYVPLGTGITLAGIWKGLNELKQLGWIRPPFPQIIAVQSSKSRPLLKMMDPDPAGNGISKDTIAVEMNVEQPAEADLIATIIREENWEVHSVDDQNILKTRKQIAENEGILLSPECCATINAYLSLKNKPTLKSNHRVVFINPVHGSKYVQSIGFLGN